MNKLFRKIIPNIDNNFHYHELTNEITLNGTFASDELYEIVKLMYKLSSKDREIKRIKSFNIDGFTSKDIKVIQRLEDKSLIRYSFYIIKDGKDWDFYYGNFDDNTIAWWPKYLNLDNNVYSGPINDFVPVGFIEMCENSYEYNGCHGDVIKFLQACGFVVEQKTC